MDRIALAWKTSCALGTVNENPGVNPASSSLNPPASSSAGAAALYCEGQPKQLTSSDAKKFVLQSGGKLEAHYAKIDCLSPDTLHKPPGGTPGDSKIIVYPTIPSVTDAYLDLQTSAVQCLDDCIQSLVIRANWFIQTMLVAWCKVPGIQEAELRGKLATYVHRSFGDGVISDDDWGDDWASFTYQRLASALQKSTRHDPYTLVSMIPDILGCCQEESLSSSQEYEIGGAARVKTTTSQAEEEEESLPGLVSMYTAARDYVMMSAEVNDDTVNLILFMAEVAIIKTSAGSSAVPLIQPRDLRNDLMAFLHATVERLGRHESAHLLTILLREDYVYQAALDVEPDIVINEPSEQTNGLLRYEPLSSPMLYSGTFLNDHKMDQRMLILDDLDRRATNLLRGYSRVIKQQELVSVAVSWWRLWLEKKKQEVNEVLTRNRRDALQQYERTKRRVAAAREEERIKRRVREERERGR